MRRDHNADLFLTWWVSDDANAGSILAEINPVDDLFCEADDPVMYFIHASRKVQDDNQIHLLAASCQEKENMRRGKNNITASKHVVHLLTLKALD